GYIKRTSLRSYGASSPAELGMRSGDSPLFVRKMSTLEQLVLFTDKGNVINRSVHELPEVRWKDVGFHLSQAITLEPEEKILIVFGVEKFTDSEELVVVTKEGFIRRTPLSQFSPNRAYLRRSFIAIGRKSETDDVVNVLRRSIADKQDIFLVSNRGFGLRYAIDEVPSVGARASGVISINLKEGDTVV